VTGVASLPNSRETIDDTEGSLVALRGQIDKITVRSTGNDSSKMATEPCIKILCGSLVQIPFETCICFLTFWHVSNENWGKVYFSFAMFVCVHVATREPLDTFL
jgi:hypothetical protein